MVWADVRDDEVHPQERAFNMIPMQNLNRAHRCVI